MMGFNPEKDDYDKGIAVKVEANKDVDTMYSSSRCSLK
jgi:hypothetical protein